MKKQLIMISLLLPLFACGDGSKSTTTATAETGIFLDSPVINIGYRTETQRGVTNPLGEYKYLLGETVTFFIGNLDFPSTPATGVVTPLNLANTQDPRNDVVVNMIRLLQTLDKDGEPSNGIEITNSAKIIATQVDFNLSPANFSTSSSVMTLITNAGQNAVVAELVSINDALVHFETTLDGTTVLSNASLNGNYFLIGQSTELLGPIRDSSTGLLINNTESFMWKNAMTFDGSGGCSFVGSIEKGAILDSSTWIPKIYVGTPDNGSCTYSLASDGTLTIDGQPSYAVSSDTNTIIGVKAFSEVGLAGTYIESMVKQSNSLSSASLNGTYHVVGKSTELLEPIRDSSPGLLINNTESFMWKNAMTFDGSGGCSFVGSIEKGAILDSTTGIPKIYVGTPDNGSCTYSLASDGTLTIDGQPSYAVSSDTNTIIGVKAFSEVGLAGTYIESMVKQSNSLSSASLNGSYHVVGKSTELLETNTESFMWKSAMTFDGSGGCSFVGSIEKGAILDSTTGIPKIYVGTPDNGSCTYSLASDGTLTIDGQPSYAVSSDTNTIIGVKAFSEVGGAGTYIESMVKMSE